MYYRCFQAFAGGIERIVYIKVKERTSQDAIDEMVKALNDLNFAPELSSLLVQITAGMCSKSFWCTYFPDGQMHLHEDYTLETMFTGFHFELRILRPLIPLRAGIASSC
jgi:hypothetical protein